jgi:rhamnosyltransferase
MSKPLVSIIMRSYNEGWALKETLPAIQAQEFRDWELIVIDSGSTDGSVELIKAANPAHFVQITPKEYVPGKVLNRGMELADTEFGIFINADATPQGTNWLAPLVTALQDKRTAAVFGRQIPRPDCRAVYANDYERCFGPERESVDWEHFFSMVSSGLRKDVWKLRGFREDLQYAEDDEYTRWCIARGYNVRFIDESVAMHSHNYTVAQSYKRSFGDALAIGQAWEGEPGEFNWLKTVMLGTISDLRKDLRYCLGRGKPHEMIFATRVRRAMRRGKLHGFRAGWKQQQEQKGQPS